MIIARKMKRNPRLKIRQNKVRTKFKLTTEMENEKLLTRIVDTRNSHNSASTKAIVQTKRAS
jgi:hypothetical protein